MSWRKLVGLAALDTADNYNGQQIRVQADREKSRVLLTATTTSIMILSPDAARHLASTLRQAAKDAEKEMRNVQLVQARAG